jgi:hypothetical protein
MTKPIEKPPAAGTVTVTAAGLCRIIGDALPFACKDPYLPTIHGVCLEAAGGILSATATDRYALGHSRTDCGGDLVGQLVISLADARLIAKLFRPAKRNTAGPDVTITAADGTARFAYSDDGSLGLVAELGIGVRSVSNDFINYTSLLNRPGDDAEPADGKAYGFRPDLLARFARVYRGSADTPMRVFPGSATKITWVEIGEQFIGGIMPARIVENGKDRPAKPTVPLGHQAAIAAPELATAKEAAA